MGQQDIGKKRWWFALMGLSVAVISAWLFYRVMTSHQEFEPMLVAGRRVEAMQQIRATDLGWRQVPKGSVDPETVQDPGLLIGKVAAVSLLPNEAIHPERVMLPQMAVSADERVTAVPTDLVRSVGASLRPGDVVDLWWVHQTELPAQRLTQRSVLLDLKDAQARPTVQSSMDARASSAIPEAVQGKVNAASVAYANAGGTSSIPAVAVVKVRSSEVGSVAKALAGGQIVLVRAAP